jgi:hypothetical protein
MQFPLKVVMYVVIIEVSYISKSYATKSQMSQVIPSGGGRTEGVEKVTPCLTGVNRSVTPTVIDRAVMTGVGVGRGTISVAVSPASTTELSEK